jgi:hypothetical protein
MDEQARLSREFLEKEHQREEREAQLQLLHAEFEKQALIRGVDDEATRQLAADNIVRLLAARGARPEPDGSIDWRDQPGVIDEAIKQAFETEDANRHREQEANLAKQSELAAQEAQRQRDAEMVARHVEALETPQMIAGAVEIARQHQQPGRYDELNQQANSVEAFLVAIAATHSHAQPEEPEHGKFPRDVRHEIEQPQHRPVESAIRDHADGQSQDKSKGADDGLMKDFVDQETKTEVEFERAQQQILGPSRGPGLTM